MRLGELLVRNKLLSETQRAEIVRAQESTGRPFGALAEEMFGVSPKAIEHAWALQYGELADWIDPLGEQIAPDALSMVERRQAWQFRCLPMRFDGRELIVATDLTSLARAMRFVGWAVPGPVRFTLASPDALSDALHAYYPMGAIDEATLAMWGNQE